MMHIIDHAPFRSSFIQCRGKRARETTRRSEGIMNSSGGKWARWQLMQSMAAVGHSLVGHTKSKDVTSWAHGIIDGPREARA